MLDITMDDFFNDPHDRKPWKFPQEDTCYVGVIKKAPYVVRRLNRNGQPATTPEGTELWALWTTVETIDGLRGFCIEDNALAKAFDGRASERNLSRWASKWEMGGRLTIQWTRADDGAKTYRGRYDPPANADTLD